MKFALFAQRKDSALRFRGAQGVCSPISRCARSLLSDVAVRKHSALRFRESGEQNPCAVQNTQTSSSPQKICTSTWPLDGQGRWRDGERATAAHQRSLPTTLTRVQNQLLSPRTLPAVPGVQGAPELHNFFKLYFQTTGHDQSPPSAFPPARGPRNKVREPAH